MTLSMVSKKQHGYNRNEYGELRPVNTAYQLWQEARQMIRKAAKSKKLPAAFDNMEWAGSRRRRYIEGEAVHHEIYDIHPHPLQVLVCVREVEGTKYGVKTTRKTYYLLKKHGRGVRVAEAKKSIAAKAAKLAECELGCAINVVSGKAKLDTTQLRACSDGVAYKKLAVLPDGRLYSIYDGSEWVMGRERYDRAMQNHNGGLYVYEHAENAERAPFPDNSTYNDADHVIIKCRVAGNYCRYGNKLAFSRVTPINIEKIL